MKKLIFLFALIAVNLPSYAFPFRPITDTTADRKDSYKPQAPFAVPFGTFNVARGKPVTSSDDAPIIGELAMITDGDKEPVEEETVEVSPGKWKREVVKTKWVELAPGTQWMQIDLKMQSRIFGVQVWHYYSEPRVYRDVVVHISDDPTFKNGVRTVYNNDQNNSSGLGKGTDREYFEDYRGFRIDTRGKNYEGVSGRYVRLYSRGNTSDPQNQYIEVEVIGKPLNAVPAKDIAARRQRGELKSTDYTLLSSYWKWPGIPTKTAEKPSRELTLPRPAEFLLPVDATDIRDDASMTLSVPAKRKISGNWWMQLDFGAPREIYALAFANTYDSGYVAHDLTVLAANDGAFTKNVRSLFNSRENRAERSEYKGDPDGGLLIDVRGSEIRGITARFLRFVRSSYELKMDVCLNAEIVGKSKHATGRPDLMLWQTKFPKQPFW